MADGQTLEVTGDDVQQFLSNPSQLDLLLPAPLGTERASVAARGVLAR